MVSICVPLSKCMQAFVTDAFWEGGGEKYERHSETSSCLCNPSSYVYVNIDNARISTRMILGAKRKKRKIREDGNTFRVDARSVAAAAAAVEKKC